MAEPVEEPQQELEPPEPELPQPEPSPEETMRERFSTEVQEGHDKPARPDYTDGP